MSWTSIAAQCVMCYRTAAAQQAARSRVLNSGIVILLIPPLLVLIGLLALAFWKSGEPAEAGVEQSVNDLSEQALNRRK